MILRLGLGFALQVVLLLLPGVSLATLRRNPFHPITAIAAGSGLVWLASFFATWQSPALGRALSIGVLVGSAASLLLRRAGHVSLRTWWRDPDVRTPLLLVPAIGLLLIGSLVLHGIQGDLTSVSGHRYIHGLPIDNVMPELLADRVIAGEPVTPFVAEWLSSDRPPLQAGATTFIRPLRAIVGRDTQYELAGIGLQLLCIPALWLLLRRLRLPRAVVLPVVLVTSSTGVVVLHAVYVWPKLLAAAFALLAIGEAIGSARGPMRALAVGTCAALAMLSHSGSAFVVPITLLAIVATAVLGLRIRIRDVALVAAVTLALMAPWSAYQRWVDPPGNRLLKWHLAGVIPIDERGTLQAVREEYSKLSSGDIIAYKRSNLAFLYDHSRVIGDAVPVGGSMRLVREREFARVVNSLGVGWLGVPAMLVCLVWRRARDTWEAAVGGALMVFGIIGVFLWSMTLFGPSATWLHAGTLVFPLLLSAGLSLFVATLGRRVLWAYVAIAALRSIHVWLLAGPESPRPTSASGFAMLAIGSVAIAGVAYGSIRAVEPVTAAPGDGHHFG